MSTLFVTGSGTGVGKTLVTSLLIAQLKARGAPVRALKPIVTGFDASDPASSDSAVLLAASSLPVDARNLDEISPWRFQAPLAPDMAAAREQRRVPFETVVEYCRSAEGDGMTLIEGVGGVMVPLDEKHVVADWLSALDVPAIVVTGSYLGTISHTLTALEALTTRGIAVRGIVVSESEEQPVSATETARSIERFSRGSAVIVLPRLRDPADAPDLLTPFGLSS